jgi:hypothetical protein
MKKIFLLLIIIGVIMTSSTVFAAEKLPLGEGNIAVKLDWIKFTDDGLGDVDADSGFYIGLEGYGMVVDDLYLGLEAGYTNPDGKAGPYDFKLTFVPVELNLKYAVEAAPQLIFDIGAGLSYSYGKVKVSDSSESDWLFGGQFFADLNYTFSQFFIGISGKYQITENISDTDHFHTGENIKCNNWRIGGQIGVMF